MYSQGDFVRDYVFPIVLTEDKDEGKNFKKFLGTGFLIGNRGYALTASHVLSKLTQNICCIFCVDNMWRGYRVINIEHHPKLDLALIKLEGDFWKTPFIISPEKQFGWIDYFLCGYPEAVLFEHDQINSSGQLLPKPDMIHTKGHIRRRIHGNIKVVKGDIFYEVSDLSGWGCSGSPLFQFNSDKSWKVIGIYIAQKIFYSENDYDKDIKYIDYGVGYAIPTDSFYEWKPKILEGKSIYEESLNFSQ